ncbi:multiple epidermal growth factor-like domains protein 11, partial [Argonauta hians]
GATDCNVKQGDCLTDEPHKKQNCSQVCSRNPENCDENVDRYGKLLKYQCHCKELKDCDFTNDGRCSGDCMYGYTGPNCQIRLYHKFMRKANPTIAHLFEPNSRECSDLPITILFNNVYRINTITLITDELHTEVTVTGGNGSKMNCILTPGSDSGTLTCQGDVSTDSVRIDGSRTCVSNVQIVGCPPELYGENCTQKCQCLNGTSCHQLTGECPNGCEPGWHGQDCQSPNYENIAKGRFAFVSEIHETVEKSYKNGECKENIISKFANFSVDGNYDPLQQHSTCASSSWMKRPYWFVVLDTNYTVNQMRIYNTQKYRNRLKGFVVLVDPSVCFESRNDEHLQDVIDIKCRNVKNSMRIIILLPVERGRLSLCEVEVLQCLPGFYGDLCKESCDKCYDNVCNQFSGDCTYGCVSGYNWNETLSHCQECDPGTYGQNCSELCNCVDNSDCHHITGSCPAGCPPGYAASDCKTVMESTQEEEDQILLIAIPLLVALLVVVLVVVIYCWCCRRYKTGKAEILTEETRQRDIHMIGRNTHHEKNSYLEITSDEDEFM